MRKKTASEVICENFKVPRQTIFQDYKCGLKGNFTFFGRLYIGEDHILFIANMFGVLKKCILPIEAITHVSEPAPHSIALTLPDADYLFTNFKNNNAHTIIHALWKKQKIASQALVSGQEEDDLLSEQCRTIDEATVEASFFNPQLVESEKQKLAEYSLPCSVEQFYAFFLADNAIVYSRKKHLEGNLSERIVVTPWKRSEELGADVREITALIRVKGVPFLSHAGLSQVWVIKHSPAEISLKVISQMSDVPYSSYFVCEQHILVSMDGEKKCRVLNQAAIVFNKHSYLKSTILTRTFQDLRGDYQVWITHVKEALENIRREEESKTKRRSVGGIKIEFEDNAAVSERSSLSKEAPSVAKSEGEGLLRLEGQLGQLRRLFIGMLVVVTLQLLGVGWLCLR